MLWLVGCYQAPDLPIVENVPVVASNACAADRNEPVACVLDGDTFDVSACGDAFGERVRMLGVDAPEIAHAPDPADCYGDEAHTEVERVVGGDRVVLSFDVECQDIYGRTLAYVWLVGSAYDRLSSEPDFEDYVRELPGAGDPAILLNEWLVSQGFAQVFPEEQFGRLAYQDDLDQAESAARAGGRGLWGQCQDTTSAFNQPPTGTVTTPGEGAGQEKG
jgi:micrococcal nuclease